MSNTFQKLSAQELQHELIEEAVRAVQRRRHIAYKMPGGLLALKAVDEKLQLLVASLASFGPTVLMHPSLESVAKNPSTETAAAYVRCALAAQLHGQHPKVLEPVVNTLVEKNLAEVVQALSDFPTGKHDFDFDCRHLVHLLEHREARVVHAAIWALSQRAGLSQAAVLLAQRQRWYGKHSASLDKAFDLVQAQLGLPLESQDWTKNLQRHGAEFALRMLAYSGQAGKAVDAGQLCALAISEKDDVQEMAWTLAILSDRAQALSALSRAQPPAPLNLRMLALAGHWPAMQTQLKPIQSNELSSEQQDMLLCCLGTQAVSAIQASTPEQVQTQLREQMLKVFWRGHIDLHNEADSADWESDQIVAQPMDAVQLRWGQCLSIGHGQPVQVQAYHQLSARMRRALLWELRHWRTPAPKLGPPVLSNARLQMAWLQTQADASDLDTRH